jgi:hypothetical protein
MEILLLSFVKIEIELYIVGDIYISDDIVNECFICDLEKCKGACCVEGELGAPLKDEELGILTKEVENIRPYLSEKGNVELDKQGYFVLDPDGEYSTPTIKGEECAYAIYEEDGKLACGIKKVWKKGKTSFRKPISCHLYPIRETQYPKFLALNYHRWGNMQSSL